MPVPNLSYLIENLILPHHHFLDLPLATTSVKLSLISYYWNLLPPIACCMPTVSLAPIALFLTLLALSCSCWWTKCCARGSNGQTVQQQLLLFATFLSFYLTFITATVVIVVEKEGQSIVVIFVGIGLFWLVASQTVSCSVRFHVWLAIYIFLCSGYSSMNYQKFLRSLLIFVGFLVNRRCLFYFSKIDLILDSLLRLFQSFFLQL